MSAIETEFYDILGINPSASQTEIKKAFNKKALVCHPDKGGDEQEYKKLQEAYETISDPNKRSLYDKYGKNKGQNNSPFGSDIFSNFFNMGMNFGRNNKPREQIPDNIIHTQNVTLEQLCSHSIIKLKFTVERLCSCNSIKQCTKCNGTGSITQTRQIGLGMIQQSTHNCSSCLGSGKFFTGCSSCNKGFIQKEQIIEVNLHPSIQDNHTFTYKNSGNQISNKKIGDFCVTIKHIKHPIFTQNKFNLILHKTISLSDALKGYKEDIVHPSSQIINLDTTGNIINPYDDYILKNMGMTSSHNLHIKFHIIFPLNMKNVEELKTLL